MKLSRNKFHFLVTGFFAGWLGKRRLDGGRGGYVTLIDDFGVRVAILHGGANSGQTSIKCHDLTCGVGTTGAKKL